MPLHQLLIAAICTLPLLSFSQNPVLVGEENLDILLLDKMVAEIQPVKREALLGSWTVQEARMYFNHTDDEPFGMAWDFDGYVYTFHDDGTFTVDAVLDTDGTWELRENNTVLYLYNNFRNDEELHHIIITGDRLEYILIDGIAYMYQQLERTH